MLRSQQPWARFRILCCVVFALSILSLPSRASAQEQDQPPAVWDIAKRVVFDPSTYAPAIIGYDSTMRDWKSSQLFFQNGYVERNPRFTLSGRPNDIAVSYDVGRRRILSDAASTLEMSLINNVTDHLFERMLAERYPNHRKLIRTLGWIERISFSSYMSYRLSVAHYHQWQANEQLARQLGYR